MKGDVHTLWKMLQPCKLVQILPPEGGKPIPKISLRRFFNDRRCEAGGVILEIPLPMPLSPAAAVQSK